jgi:hypothetical protein
MNKTSDLHLVFSPNRWTRWFIDLKSSRGNRQAMTTTRIMSEDDETRKFSTRSNEDRWGHDFKYRYYKFKSPQYSMSRLLTTQVCSPDEDIVSWHFSLVTWYKTSDLHGLLNILWPLQLHKFDPWSRHFISHLQRLLVPGTRPVTSPVSSMSPDLLIRILCYVKQQTDGLPGTRLVTSTVSSMSPDLFTTQVWSPDEDTMSCNISA